MDVHWYGGCVGSGTQAWRLLLWLWFCLIPGVCLVIVYCVNLYNDAVVCSYNNSLAWSGSPCSGGGSLGVAHVCAKKFHSVILFSCWYRWGDCGIWSFLPILLYCMVMMVCMQLVQAGVVAGLPHVFSTLDACFCVMLHWCCVGLCGSCAIY